MKLSELAFACYIYTVTSQDDRTYRTFLKVTDNQPDLTKAKHREELLKWLNTWQCRQFATKYHGLASNEIKEWHKKWRSLLPDPQARLHDLSDDALEKVNSAYLSLVQRKASYRTRKDGNEDIVRIGKTGASKILFGIRPKSLVAWDDPIRQKLITDKQIPLAEDKSYLEFLRFVRREIESLEENCRENGFTISDVPALIGKKESKLLKLIDEYHWITITGGYKVPPPDLAKWQSWK